MTALSAVSRIPLPTDDDILDYSGICANFCNAVDSMLIPRYNSTAERDAAHASSSTPGEICTIADSSGGVLVQTRGVGGWVTVEDVEVAFKPTATSQTNNTTLTADPHLKFTLLPNSTYIVKGKVSYFSGSPNPDIKTGWIVTGTGLTTIARVIYGGHDGSATAGEPGFVSHSTNLTTPVSIGLIDNSRKFFEVMLCLTTGSTSVLIEYAWSQNTNNGTALTLHEGSYLEANRIAGS